MYICILVHKLHIQTYLRSLTWSHSEESSMRKETLWQVLCDLHLWASGYSDPSVLRSITTCVTWNFQWLHQNACLSHGSSWVVGRCWKMLGWEDLLGLLWFASISLGAPGTNLFWAMSKGAKVTLCAGILDWQITIYVCCVYLHLPGTIIKNQPNVGKYDTMHGWYGKWDEKIRRLADCIHLFGSLWQGMIILFLSYNPSSSWLSLPASFQNSVKPSHFQSVKVWMLGNSGHVQDPETLNSDEFGVFQTWSLDSNRFPK